MAVIVILILASLAMALFFLGGFIWAVRSGQFDDTCTPSMRVLTDETVGRTNRPVSPTSPNSQTRSADLQSAVSQAWSLPSVGIPDAAGDTHVLPTASRRYGRLQVCATEPPPPGDTEHLGDFRAQQNSTST